MRVSPDQRLALVYAKRRFRTAFEALMEFDRTLGLAVSSASMPVLGQIRLAWWREKLQCGEDIGTLPPPLRSIFATQCDPAGLRARLNAMVDGWERLLHPAPLADDQLMHYAIGRGGGLFEAAAILADEDTSKSIANAGCAWAFGDFAFHCSDKILAQRVIDIAKSIEIHRAHIPRNLLPFSIVLRFSWRDIGRGIEKGSASGRPSRMFDALLVASGIW